MCYSTRYCDYYEDNGKKGNEKSVQVVRHKNKRLPKSTAYYEENYGIGNFIYHKQFGSGIVKTLKITDEKVIIGVSFYDAPIKKLSVVDLEEKGLLI